MPSFQKVPRYENEQLRRAVASLPCVACGIWNHTQCAHIGGVADGKGRGIKVGDANAAALCGPRFGNEGCHAAFDQGRIDPERGWEFVAKTYIALMEAGLLKLSRKFHGNSD